MGLSKLRRRIRRLRVLVTNLREDNEFYAAENAKLHAVACSHQAMDDRGVIYFRLRAIRLKEALEGVMALGLVEDAIEGADCDCEDCIARIDILNNAAQLLDELNACPT